MLFAGIDEAGRGSLLGPLVMALVCLPDSEIPSLRDMRVRDSKSVSTEERARLQARIKRLARKKSGMVSFKAISPRQIDRFRSLNREGGLNELERRTARTLLISLAGLLPVQEPLTIILDGEKIFGPLARFSLEGISTRVRAEDRADQKFPIVSAASIVAKHHRDLYLQKIFSRYTSEFGDIGGNGYPNAPTKQFLLDYKQRYGCYPPEVRKTWKTLEEIEQPKQSELFSSG